MCMRSSMDRPARPHGLTTAEVLRAWITSSRFQSDHMMVCATFRVPNIVPRPEQREAKRWSPTYLNIQRAKHSRLVKWRDQVIGLCEHFLPKAESALARER